MADPENAFKKLFIPTDGGYIYYPSRKEGGKLVTQSEFEQLVDGWNRANNRKLHWLAVLLFVAALVVWGPVSESLGWPTWASHLPAVTFVLAAALWFLRAVNAPRRLVKGRPDIAPQQSMAEARRHARSMITWPFAIFGTTFSCGVFWICFSAASWTLGVWAGMIGSSLVFGTYVWIIVSMLRDRAT